MSERTTVGSITGELTLTIGGQQVSLGTIGLPLVASDIDLSEATKAAGEALHLDACTEGGMHTSCDVGDWDREAGEAIRAALPAIREQLAQQIETLIAAKALREASEAFGENQMIREGDVKAWLRDRSLSGTGDDR